MDLNELIESTLRSQHLEEMQNRPREEYSPRNFRQGSNSWKG